MKMSIYEFVGRMELQLSTFCQWNRTRFPDDLQEDFDEWFQQLQFWLDQREMGPQEAERPDTQARHGGVKG